ncbi:MAG: hypothetical protein ACE5GX_15805 [Thermoanaerobaculia bacterium]
MPSPRLGALGYGYALLDRRTEARAILRELENDFPESISTAFYRAPILAGLGEPGRALDLLEEAVAGREPWIIGLKLDPGFRLLAETPRFRAMLAQVEES